MTNGRIWIIEVYDQENDKYEFKVKLINDNVAPSRTNKNRTCNNFNGERRA